MPTVAEIEALVAAKIASGTGDGLGLTRLAADYRTDLNEIPAGETRYQLRVLPIGRAGQSNAQTRVAAFAVSILHRLGASEAERDWTLGALLTHLDKLTRAGWWCPDGVEAGIAGIAAFLNEPESIPVATSRELRLLETIVGPIRVEIAA